MMDTRSGYFIATLCALICLSYESSHAQENAYEHDFTMVKDSSSTITFLKTFEYDNTSGILEKNVRINVDGGRSFMHKMNIPAEIKLYPEKELPVWLRYDEKFNALIGLPFLQKEKRKIFSISMICREVELTLRAQVKVHLYFDHKPHTTKRFLHIFFHHDINNEPFTTTWHFMQLIEQFSHYYVYSTEMDQAGLKQIESNDNNTVETYKLAIAISASCRRAKLRMLFQNLFKQDFIPIKALCISTVLKDGRKCSRMPLTWSKGSPHEHISSGTYQMPLVHTRRIRSVQQYFPIPNIFKNNGQTQNCQRNTPPIPKQNLIVFNVRPNQFSHIMLGDSLFTDAEDGNMRKLILNLKWFTGKDIELSHWIQYSASLQFIYAWPTYDVLMKQPVDGYKFILTARDQCNAVGTMNLHINIDKTISKVQCYHFVLFVESKMDINTPYIHVLVDLINILNVYYNDTKLKNMLVTNFNNVIDQKNTFLLSFSDQSINCQPCDIVSINEKLLLSRRDKFKRKFEPNFRYLGFTVDLESCIGNSPPLVLCPVPMLNITRYRITKYKLPINTFYDAEDGFTDNLKLTVTAQLMQNDIIVLRDKRTLYIYQISTMPRLQRYAFAISAVDSANSKAILNFDVSANFETLTSQASFYFAFNAYYEQSMTDQQILLQVLHRLSQYISGNTNINQIVILSFYHSGVYPKLIQIRWTNSTFFNSVNQLEKFTYVKNKIFLGESLSFSFISFMLPFIRDIQGSYRNNIPTDGQKPTSTVNNQMQTTINSKPLSETIEPTPTINPSGNGLTANYHIGPFMVTFCDFFVYPIPANLFHDIDDGNTRNLNLSLHTSNHVPVRKDSWLQIDPDIQMVYGFLKVTDYVNAGGKKTFYNLVARNSKGYSTSLRFEMNLPEKIPQIFYQVTMTLNTFYDNKIPDINEQLLLLLKISSYFGEAKFSWVNILSFSRNNMENLVTIAWTNCTLSDAGVCPVSAVKSLSSQVVLINGIPNSRFASYLAPQYIIKDISVSFDLNCSTTIASSVSITPTPVITTKPVVMNRIGTLQLYTTKLFKYKIPFNTFLDSTDGYTPFLTLTLLNINGNNLPRSSWIQFNKAAQEIYASLYVDVLAGFKRKTFQYVLLATNSYKRTSNLTLALECIRTAVPNGGLSVEISGSEYYSSAMNDLQVFMMLLQKYIQYSGPRIEMEVKSFSRVSGPPGGYSVIFIYNQGTASSQCNTTAVSTIKNKITYWDQEINPFLILAFLPEIVVSRAKTKEFGICYDTTPNTTHSPGPRIKYNLPVLYASNNAIFRYLIPSQTFYDIIDGETRNLKLDLYNNDGSAVPKDSWLQMAPKQQLIGMLTTNDLRGVSSRVFQYILRATNSKGLYVDMTVHISTIVVSVANAFSITLTGNYYFTGSSTNVDVLIYLIETFNVHVYGSVTQSQMSVINFYRQSPPAIQFSIVIVDSRLNQGNCNSLLYRTVYSKIFTNSGSVNSLFAFAFYPKISLTGAIINTKCPATTSISVSSSVITTMVPPGPIIKHQIPVLYASNNEIFRYLIPSQTFHDVIDGGTRDMNLDLYNSDGSAVHKDSWLQLSTNQQLIGALTANDLQGAQSRVFQYILRATNSKGLYVDMTVHISTIVASITNAFRIILTGNYYFPDSSTNVDVLIYFVEAFNKHIYGSTTQSQMSVINFIRQVPPAFQFSIVIIDSRLNQENCNSLFYRTVYSKIFTNSGSINSQFVYEFYPKISLIGAAINAKCPATTSISISSSIITTTASPGPIIKYQIPVLYASNNEIFRYLVPSHTFHDVTDGGTKNLNVGFYNNDGSAIHKYSWLQLSTNQELIGVLTANDLRGASSRVFQYIIRATNSKGLYVDMTVHISTVAISVANAFRITLTGNYYFPGSSSNIDVLIYLIEKLNLYLYGTIVQSQMSVINFNRQSPPGIQFSIVLVDSRLNLANCDSLHYKIVYSKIFTTSGSMNPQFSIAFYPKASLFNVEIDKNCHSSTTIIPSPTMLPNTPPRVNIQIPAIQIYFCQSIFYYINPQTFLDDQDGNTRSLNVELLSLAGEKLKKYSWIQWNKNLQVIYGLLKFSDYAGPPFNVQRYLLRATDSGGLSVSTVVTLNLPPERIKYNFKISLIFTPYYDISVAKVDEQMLIMRKLSEYFVGQSYTQTQFVSYENIQHSSHVKLDWIFCGLPYSPCPVNKLQEISSKLITHNSPDQAFLSAMKPQYNLIDVSLAYLGPCVMRTFTSHAMISSLQTSLLSGLYSTPLTVISPSTVTSIVSSPINRLPPVPINVIPTLKPKQCGKMVYRIPDKAFYDPQDGFTPNLKLDLVYTNGTSFDSSSWLQFDSTKQSIHGVLTNGVIMRYLPSVSYKLVATNRYGLSAYHTITFELPPVTHLTHVFTFSFTLTNRYPNEINSIILATSKINSYMQVGDNVQVISFKHYRTNYMSMKWSICNVDSHYCNKYQIKTVTDMFFTQENFIKASFINAMYPDINVIQLLFQFAGICLYTTSYFFTATMTLLPSPSPSPPHKNLPPAILKLIPLLNVTTCTQFQYQLPEDTFFDVEDGLTRNLNIRVFDEFNTPLSSSWILYNSSTQRFTGVLTVSEVQHVNQFTYNVIAVDKGGLSIAQQIIIKVLDYGTRYPDNIIDTYGSVYDQLTKWELKLLISSKLTSYLITNATSWTGVRIYSVALYGQYNKKIHFKWSICQLQCSEESLRNLQSLLMSSDVLKVAFVVLMKPSIIITETSVSNSGSCSVKYTTSKIISTSSFITTSSPTVNTPPIVYAPVPVLMITNCKIFKYQIPKNTCFDSQDGFTPKLTIRLLDTKYVDVGQNSWIHLNPITQKIYGIFKIADISEARNNIFSYFLVCIDKEGASVHQRIHIVIKGVLQTPAYSITVQSYIYISPGSSYAEIQLLWIKKLGLYLMDNTNEKVQIVSFRKSTVLYPQIIISWYNCSIKDPCSDEGKLMKSKLFDINESLNTRFTQAMIPEFVLISGKFQETSPCIKSSTSSAFVPSSSSSVGTANRSPVVLIDELRVVIKPCSKTIYQVPTNTFYDHEDGYTPNLNLKLVNSDGTGVTSLSCIQFNSTTQTLFGIYVHNDFLETNTFMLVAMDSKGLTAATIVRTELDKPIEISSHVFFARAYLYSKYKNKISLLQTFSSKLIMFYGDKNDENIMFQSVRFDNNHVEVGWINCSLAKTCEKSKMNAVKSKVLFYDTIINAEFIASLAPVFIVTYLQFSYGPRCQSILKSILKTPIFTTPALYSSMFVISINPTNTPAFNTPPSVRKPLVFIEVPICSSFSYRIPRGTFYDVEDGSTRNLKLDLVTFNEQALPKSSWIQFVQSTQVVYGHPRVIDLKNTKSYMNYILKARDSGDASVTTVLTLVLPPKPDVSFNINITVNRFFDYDTPDLTAQLFLVSKICSYVGDLDVTKVLVLEFKRSEPDVFLSWTNCTIQSYCTSNSINHLISKFVSNGKATISFQNTIQPYYEVKKVSGNILKKCSVKPTTSVIYPTSALKPTPTIVSSLILTTTSILSTSSALVNRPPRIYRLISPVQVSLCNSFAYHIPEDIFVDEDGTTSLLALELLELNGNSLSRASWIQFNSQLQVAYGMLKVMDISVQPLDGYKYVLKATDSYGLSAPTILRFMKVVDPSRIGFLIEMDVRCSYDNPYPFVNDLFQIINKVIQYFGDANPSTIKTIDLVENTADKGLIKFIWTNCTLNFDTCPENKIAFIISKILDQDRTPNAQFRSVFSPQYTLEKIKVKYNSPCSPPSKNKTVTPSPSPTQVPVINLYIPPITTNFCSHLSFLIPNTTFYDYQDGYTRNLKLSLTFINGSIIPRNYWLQLDSEKQIINWFSSVASQFQVPMNGYLFTLKATDKDQNSVTMNIRVNILKKGTPLLQNITLELTQNFNLQLSDSALQDMLFQRISKFYGDSDLRFLNLIEYSIDRANQLISMTWFNCSLNTLICDKELAYWIQAQIMNNNGKCKAQFAYIFLPEFSVRQLMIRNDKSCINATSSIIISPTKAYTIYPTSSFVMPNTITAVKNITVNVSYCGSIKYPIPNDVFYDSRNASISFDYSLLFTDNQLLTCGSWIQYRPDVNQLFGTAVHTQSNSPKKYLLQAQNNIGGKAVTHISFNILESLPTVTYRVAISFLTSLNSSVCDAQVTQIITEKLKTYFKDESDHHISVIYFSRGDKSTRSYIMWSNCSLRTDPCDFVNINKISALLYQGNTSKPHTELIKAMKPEFHSISVLDEQTGPCTMNNVLAIGQKPDVICAKICGEFVYQIPDDTFIDPEDGKTHNLILEVLHLDRSHLSKDSWIEFHQSSKKLHGFPTETVKREQPKNGYLYLITAYDTEGATAAVILTIKVCGEIPSYENSATLNLECSLNVNSTIQAIIHILHDMSKTYLDGSLDSIFLVNYSSAGSKIKFTWANCTSPQIGISFDQLDQPFTNQCLPVNTTIHDDKDYPPVKNITNIRLKPSYCGENVYNFPSNAFYDKEDGAMELLRLSFTHVNGTRISSNYWVGFVRSTLKIYILPTNETRKNTVYQYLFIASDSKNQTTNITLYIELFEKFPQLNYILHVQYRAFSNLPTVAKIYTFFTKLRSFTESNSTLIVNRFRTFQNSTMIIEFGNCSLPIETCAYSTIDDISLTVQSKEGRINADLVAFMFPECLLEKIYNTKLETCLLEPNSSPKLINEIPNLNVTECGYLKFHIPEKTFYDLEDGWTKNLTLKLFYKNSCWLEFDPDKQIIYAIATNEALTNQPLMGYILTLEASDDRGDKVNTTIKMLFSAVTPTSFELVIILEVSKVIKYSCLQERIFILNKLMQYFNSNTTLTLKSLQKGADGLIIEVVVKNCTMRYTPCDYVTIDKMIARLEDKNGALQTSFRAFMSPEYIPKFLSKRKDTTCLDSSNTPPVINASLNFPTISSCYHQQFKLPSTLVVDIEDGNIYNMKVRLINAITGFEITNTSWLYLDAVTFYMSITGSKVISMNQPKNGYQFLLEVEDSRQQKVTMKLAIFLNDTSGNETFAVTQKVTIEKNHKSFAAAVLHWKNVTEVKLNLSIQIISYKFKEDSFKNRFFYVRWTLCEIEEIHTCNFRAIHKIERWLNGNDVTNNTFNITRYGSCLNEPLYPPNSTANNTIYINPCKKLNYILPNDIFVDEKDGGTRNLSITLQQIYPGEPATFISYNMNTQQITGVIILQFFERYRFIEYELQATDSDGLKSNTTLKLLIDQNYERQFQFETKVLYYQVANEKDEFVKQFCDKVKVYLNLHEQGLILYNYNESKSSVLRYIVQFTPCTLVGKSCSLSTFNQVSSLMISSSGKPTFGFVSALLENIIPETIETTQLSACNDSSPKLGVAIGPLNTSICNHVNYKIPENAFIDLEQGGSSNLTIMLQNNHSYSWIQFNKTSQVLHMRPTLSDLVTKPDGGYTVLLIASDKSRNTVRQHVTIHIDGDLSDYNYLLRFQMSSRTNMNTNKNGLQNILQSKINTIVTRKFTDVTVVNVSTSFATNRIFYFSIYDCSLLKEFCQSFKNYNLLSLFVNSKNNVLDNVKQLFNPEFEVLNVTGINMNMCQNISKDNPYVTDKIQILNLTLCQQLRYRIPDGLFMDVKDGVLTGKAITFCTEDGKYVTADSPIQYNQKTKVIYGYLTQKLFQKYQRSKLLYLLKATDSDNNTINCTINIALPNKVVNNYIITTYADTYIDHTLPDLEVLLNAMSRINGYFKDPIDNLLSIIDFERTGVLPQKVRISWTNCSVINEDCDKNKTNYIFNKVYIKQRIVNPYYIEALGVDFGFIHDTTKITTTNACSPNGNNPPVSNQNITLNITFCGTFHYELDNSTFTDMEDGNTKNLVIVLKFINHSNVPSSLWVHYDDTIKTLYGIPDDNALQQDQWKYILVATDTGEKTATTFVTIYINTTGLQHQTFIHEIETVATCKKTTQSEPAIKSIIQVLSTITLELESSISKARLKIFYQNQTGIYINWLTCAFLNLTNIHNTKNQIVGDCTITDIRVKIKATTIFYTSTVQFLTSNFFIPTTVIYPALSTIIPRTSSISIPSNTPPVIVNSIPTIVLTCGKPLLYKIPEDTFYDAQDGFTSNLKLELLDENLNEVNRSYVQFLNKTYELVFFISVEHCNKVIIDRYLKVRATDSDGNPVFDTFKLREVKESISCCMYISAIVSKKYTDTNQDNYFINSFYKTITEDVYNDVNDNIRIVTFSIKNETLASIVYTDKTITNTTCVQNSTRFLTNPVFKSDGSIQQSSLKKLSNYSVDSAKTLVNKNCNTTAIVIPPVTPVGAGELSNSAEDWFLYLLPLFILAFMLLMCCFCFYICRYCYQTAFGVKPKAKNKYLAPVALDEPDAPLPSSYTAIPHEVYSDESVDAAPRDQSWDVPSEQAAIAPMAGNDRDLSPAKSIQSSAIEPVILQDPVVIEDTQAVPSVLSRSDDLYAKPIRRSKKIFQSSRKSGLSSKAHRTLNVSQPLTTSYIAERSVDFQHLSSIQRDELQHRVSTRGQLRLPAIPNGPPPPYSPPRKTRIFRQNILPSYYERYVQQHRTEPAIAIPLRSTIIKSPRRSITVPKVQKRRRVVSLPLMKKSKKTKVKRKQEKQLPIITLPDSTSPSDLSSQSSTTPRFSTDSQIEMKAIIKGNEKALKKILNRSPVSYLSGKAKRRRKNRSKYEVTVLESPRKRTKKMPKKRLSREVTDDVILRHSGIPAIRRHHPYRSYNYKFTQPFLYDYVPIRRTPIRKQYKLYNYDDPLENMEERRSSFLRRLIRREKKSHPTLDELLGETLNDDVNTPTKKKSNTMEEKRGANTKLKQKPTKKAENKETWISLDDLNPVV